MADAILPNEGLADLLAYMISAPIAGVLPWQLLLWTNDLEPTWATVYSDLTEAKFDGYARVSMQRDYWSTAEVSDGCANSTYGNVPYTWTCGGAVVETVYGAAYYDRSSNVLRWIQRFDAGDVVQTTSGVRISVLPPFSLTSACCGGQKRKRGTRAAERRKGKRS